jgi:hypothetical protein
METGVVSGYADPNLLLQKMALSDRLARKSLLNSFTELKPQLPQLVFDHCGLHLFDVFAFDSHIQRRWNEMKIVRSFKSDPHPSIIPFHSFIITPSYALITM